MNSDYLFNLVLSGSVDDTNKVLFIAAHPDDEVIGAGSLFTKIKNISFLHTTNGAPLSLDYSTTVYSSPEEYSDARFKEFYEALKLIQVFPQYHIKLGFIDQETSFNLVELTHQLLDVFINLNPDYVFVHPYEGGHPDHDSTAFAVHNAAYLFNSAGNDVKVLEYTSYFSRNGLIQTGEFLRALRPVCSLDLHEDQKIIKRRMLECFPSQAGILKYFGTERELFRKAPKYDFTKKASKGMFYDLNNWGIDSYTWIRNASYAIYKIRSDYPVLNEYT